MAVHRESMAEMPQFRRFANPILRFHKSRMGANEGNQGAPPFDESGSDHAPRLAGESG